MEVSLEGCLPFIALLAHARFSFMKTMLSGAPRDKHTSTEMGGKYDSDCLEATAIWPEQNALVFSLGTLGPP